MLRINEAGLMGWVGIVDAPQEGAPLKFTVATERTWKDRGTGAVKSETEWHRVTVWKPDKRLLERVAKGARVYAEGRIRHSEYQKNGEKRTARNWYRRLAYRAGPSTGPARHRLRSAPDRWLGPRRPPLPPRPSSRSTCRIFPYTNPGSLYTRFNNLRNCTSQLLPSPDRNTPPTPAEALGTRMKLHDRRKKDPILTH